MKNKKFLLIISIVLILIFITILSVIVSNFTANNYYNNNKKVEVNEISKINEEVSNNYYAKKEDGYIYFKISQIKPSACHIINFNKTDFNKEIILDLNITKYADRCTSDNLVDTISGEIEIEDPKSIEIRVDGNRVYYNKFF